MAQDDAIYRLARQIEAARKSETAVLNAEEVESVRRHGAAELHRICADFVASVNGTLPVSGLQLSPATFSGEQFRPSAVNIFQVDSQGREMQIAFRAPATLMSTEKFLVPYVLEGEIRTYNQKMLDRFEIRSVMVFFCVDERTCGWRFFDWRTRHTGPVDRERLARFMEPLF